MRCPICLNNHATVENHLTRDASVVDCPQCLGFTISRRAQVNLANWDGNERWKISAWLVQNKPAVFTTSDLDVARAARRPSIRTRADRMLRWLVDHIPAGRIVAMFDPMRNHGEWFVKTWAGGKENDGKKLLSQPLVSVG